MVNAIAKRKREFILTGHGKLGAFFGTHMSGITHFILTTHARRK